MRLTNRMYDPGTVKSKHLFAPLLISVYTNPFHGGEIRSSR